MHTVKWKNQRGGISFHLEEENEELVGQRRLERAHEQAASGQRSRKGNKEEDIPWCAQKGHAWSCTVNGRVGGWKIDHSERIRWKPWASQLTPKHPSLLIISLVIPPSLAMLGAPEMSRTDLAPGNSRSDDAGDEDST